MAQVITTAGEQLFAIKAQNNQPLDIDTFIFAYVPGQDSSAAIDRNEGLPPVGQRVHQQIVQQRGRVNSNVVIYSTVLDSITGPFEFNWVGLYSSVNNTLVAISKIPTVVKTVTVPGTAGNILNRNFGIEYSGIADLDGITVDPETWQLDYTARLNGMDELTRQLAADMNGRDWFIDNGFKVAPLPTPNNFKVTAGAGYVSGLRIAIEEEPTLIAASYPQFVYVNAWFDGTSEATWKGQTTFQITPAEQEDYTDETGKRHYLFKLATITAANTVIDHRSGKATSPHSGIKQLLKVPDIIQTALSFHTDFGIGVADYIWHANESQISHLKKGPNGGVLFASGAMAIFDGTPETLDDFLNWAGFGSGCWELLCDKLCPEFFGSLGISNDQLANEKLLASAVVVGLPIEIKRPTYLTSTLLIPSGVELACIGEGKFVAALGFIERNQVLKFGDKDTDVRWTGKGKDLVVDCQGQRVVGIQFSRAWEHADFDHIIVHECAYIPVQTVSGFGLKIKSIDATAPSIRSGYPANAQVDSIGVLWEMSDSYITGACKATGYFVGFKATGSNNKFNGIHPYGLYENDGIPQTCPMGVCIWNEGQGNRFTNSIADSPSKIDYEAPASLTNGGYGTVNRGNGYQTSFDGITVFIPDRTVFGETIPTGLRAHYCGQLASYTNAEINDQTNVSIDKVQPLVGPQASACRYEGIERQQIYSRNPPNHLVKPYFRRGIEFNATYQDGDNFSSGFGSCSFSLVSRNFFQVNSNYEGNISAIKIERIQSGNTAVQAFLSTVLGAGDAGYRFYRTDTKKFRIWNGSAFQDGDGCLNFFPGYNIPSLAAGETHDATFTANGVSANWIANVAFSLPNSDIQIWAFALTNEVKVFFRNITSSATSASDAGTLCINCVPLS